MTEKEYEDGIKNLRASYDAKCEELKHADEALRVADTQNQVLKAEVNALRLLDERTHRLLDVVERLTSPSWRQA